MKIIDTLKKYDVFPESINQPALHMSKINKLDDLDDLTSSLEEINLCYIYDFYEFVAGLTKIVSADKLLNSDAFADILTILDGIECLDIDLVFKDQVISLTFDKLVVLLYKVCIMAADKGSKILSHLHILINDVLIKRVTSVKDYIKDYDSDSETDTSNVPVLFVSNYDKIMDLLCMCAEYNRVDILSYLAICCGDDIVRNNVNKLAMTSIISMSIDTLSYLEAAHNDHINYKHLLHAAILYPHCNMKSDIESVYIRYRFNDL